jgi:hypothetical protein
MVARWLGFYGQPQSDLGDTRDETVDPVSNLVNGIPIYSQKKNRITNSIYLIYLYKLLKIYNFT